MTNIPVGAQPVSYNYGNGVRGIFYVWVKNTPTRIKQVNSIKWQWSALGQEGEQATKERAIEAARVWIISRRKYQGDN